MNPNTMTPADLVAIRAKQSTLNQQSDEIRRRRDALAAKLAALELQAAAPAAAAAEAQTAMAAALLVDDQQAVEDARARVDAAGQQAAKAVGLNVEIEALKRAVATLDADMSKIADEAALIANDEKAALLRRLDLEGADLPADLAASAAAVVSAYAKASVLSQIAVSAGGDPGRYGPTRMEPMTLLNLGVDRMNKLFINVQPADVMAAVTADVVAKLRGEGWQV